MKYNALPKSLWKHMAPNRVKLIRPNAPYRSKEEREYAEMLDVKLKAGDIRAWKHEKLRLGLGDRVTYTPDFLVWTKDGAIELHEVKGGWIRDVGRVKFKVAQEQFPMFRFVLAQKSHGQWLITEPGV